MPNDETDGITEPRNDLSYVAERVADSWSGRRADLEPTDTAEAQPPNADSAAQPDLAALLRDASPEEIRHLIVGPGLFVGSGADVQAATRIWDGVVETVRSAFVHVEGEAAWGRFLQEEQAREEQAAVVESIRQGFLHALEEGGVAPLPADGAHPEKGGPGQVGPALELNEETVIGIDPGDGETVTVVIEADPDVTVEPDDYFDGVPAHLTALLRERAHDPGPGGIPIDLLDQIEAQTAGLPEPPATSIFGEIDRELAEEAAAERAQRTERRVPLWIWPALAAVALAVIAFVALIGSENDAEPTGGGSGSDPGATSTVAGGATNSDPTVAATAARTPNAAELPTLVVCPDGTSFSGYEQADGSYLDAETNEPRVCPPPPD